MTQNELTTLIGIAAEDTDKVLEKAKAFGESLLCEESSYVNGADMDKTVVKGIEAYLNTFQTLLYQRTYANKPMVSGGVGSTFTSED